MLQSDCSPCTGTAEREEAFWSLQLDYNLFPDFRYASDDHPMSARATLRVPAPLGAERGETTPDALFQRRARHPRTPWSRRRASCRAMRHRPPDPTEGRPGCSCANGPCLRQPSDWERIQTFRRKNSRRLPPRGGDPAYSQSLPQTSTDCAAERHGS